MMDADDFTGGCLSVIVVLIIAIGVIMTWALRETRSDISNLSNSISATQNQISELRNEMHNGQ